MRWLQTLLVLFMVVSLSPVAEAATLEEVY